MGSFGIIKTVRVESRRTTHRGEEEVPGQSFGEAAREVVRF